MIIYQVDAFTKKPFSGNPAAVCILPEPREESWMRDVAREMNLSETAFLTRREDGYNLRWFTPAVEVDLCGHATLASAHVLWEAGHLKPEAQARFHTVSGLLTASRRGDWIEMDFPAEAPVAAELPAGLTEALGATPKWSGRSGRDYLVEVDSEETVRRLEPDFKYLKKLPRLGGMEPGVIVTARAASPGVDFVSRYFASAAGIDEDPVTGSTHCCLGPFWADRLGKNELSAFQASARGGSLKVKTGGDRVILSGQAVTVLKAELL